MIKFYKITILLLSLFSFYLNANNELNLTKEEKNYLKNNPILKVQGISTFPPFNFLENDKTMGYTVDYLNLMSKYLNVKFEFTKGKSFPETIAMFKNGEIDILPHIAKNKNREKFIEYTDFIHIKYPIGLTLKKDLKISSFNQLKDKTIAIIEKAFTSTYIKNNYPNQKIFYVKSTNDGVLAVSNEKADAFIGSIPTMSFYIKKNWLDNVKTIQIEDLGLPSKVSLPMGVQKGNTLLKSILEKVNDKINYTEELNLKEKWLNIPNESPKVSSLTIEEKNYLKTKKEINICVLPNWLPFEQIDEKGNHKGIGHDILNLISIKINKKFVLVPTNQWSQSLQSIRNRKCDILPVAMDVPSRRDAMNFTKPYVAEPFVIATTNDKFFIRDEKDLSSKKIGVVKSYAFIEVLKQKNPLIKIVEVKDTKEGLEKVNNGELFGYIDTMPTIGYFIQKFGFYNLKIAGKLPYDITLSIASRNDEPLLNSIMQKALNTIPQEKIRAIVGKWIEIKVHQEFDYTKLFYISVFFTLVILLGMYRNKKITEQKNEFKQIIKNSTDGVFIMDLEGNLKEYSDKACEMLGYTKEEMLQLNIKDWEYSYPKEEALNYLKTITPQTIKIRTKHKRKDGSIYDADIHASKIKISNEERIYASVRDITKENELRKKILEQKEELETIFNYSQDGIAIIDLKSNFLKFNNTYLKISGFTKDELYTKSCVELTTPEDKEKLIKSLNEAKEKGYIQNLEISYLLKNKKRISVNISLSLLPDKKSFILLTKDITNLKLLESQSRLASMGQMIGNIAHQWRQPLNVITTSASALKLESDLNLLNKNSIEKSSNTIIKQAMYLSNTIENFKNFIKNDSELKEVSLKKAIEKSISLTQASLDNNYIELILKIDDKLKIYGNENELIEAFVNIINNSKDALKENTKKQDKRLIYINTNILEENQIELQITDSAGGIKEDLIDRIFEPYFTTKHQSQGTGLGLAIVDKILRERHNAIINVYNSSFNNNNTIYYGMSISIIFKTSNKN